MSYAQSHIVEATTATGGAVSAFTPVVTGRVSAIIYTRPTGAPYASTADFTVTTEDSGQNVWVEANVNASTTVNPVIASNIAGTGAASSLTESPIYAASERIKISIADGGNTKTGSFTVIIA